MPESPRLVHMLRNLLDPDPNPCVPTCAACREQGPLVMPSRTDRQPPASLLATDAHKASAPTYLTASAPDRAADVVGTTDGAP